MFTKINIHHKLIIFLVLLIILEISIFLSSSIKSNLGATVSQKNIEIYANNIIQKCKDEKYKPTCYDKEIPKLLEKINMEDAFRVTKVVQTDGGAEYEYCHVLGHNLAAKETTKDPSKWKDVITRCPSGMCSNGCIHGAFQERFRTESMSDVEIDKIIPELQTVCESRGTWNPTGMEKATCYHAVGHLAMFISGGNINKSNEVCEKLAPQYFPVCFDGNFMQIFQPLSPEDFDLVKNIAPKTKKAAETFCNNFSGLPYESCYQESWPLNIGDIYKPGGLVAFCAKSKRANNLRCYDAMFYVVAAQLKLDILRIKEFCSILPNSKKGLCFSNSASRMIETDYSLSDRAISLCQATESFGVGQACYEGLIKFTTFNYHSGSEEAKYLCAVMPEPWKSKCESKQ